MAKKNMPPPRGSRLIRWLFYRHAAPMALPGSEWALTAASSARLFPQQQWN